MPYREYFNTYRTLVAKGRSAAAGALSSPRLEQLTTQAAACWGPARAQLQLSGQGPQLAPPPPPPWSPRGPEPQASRQHSATSNPEKTPKLGGQTPCFRLDRGVSPFPPGIAHSHLIAPGWWKSSPSGKKSVSESSAAAAATTFRHRS